MSRIIQRVAVGIVSLVLTFPVVAADLKLGYVDAVRLFQDAPQATQAEEMLRQEFSDREKLLLEQQKRRTDMERKLSRDGMTMGESERKKLDNELLALSREMRRDQDEFREDLNRRRNEEIAKVQDFIKQVINDIGEEEGFDLIFFEGIAFANRDLDITAKVLERLETVARK